MRKLFVKLSGYLLAILATLLVAFFIVQSFAPVTGGLIGSIRMKNKILQATTSPRIIIAAGSSAPHCFISNQITEALKMPVVNMGATAYLGAKFYLSAIEPEIKQGDIIILAFEFNIYNGSYSGELVWNAVENDYSLIKKLPLEYWPKLATSYFSYAKNKLTTHITKPLAVETDEEFYTGYGFSQTGDLPTQRELKLEKGYNSQDMHSITEKTLDKGVANAIKSFAQRAEQKGAKVYITAAPINKLSLNDDTDIAAFQSRLSAETGVKIIGDMQNGVMESEYFYDSNFHLNSKGAEIYTKCFINEYSTIINK